MYYSLLHIKIHFLFLCAICKISRRATNVIKCICFLKALSTFDYFVYTCSLKVTQYVHVFKEIFSCLDANVIIIHDVYYWLLFLYCANIMGITKEQ